MSEGHWVLFVVIIVCFFALGWALVHVTLRAFRRGSSGNDEEVTKEAEALKTRADENVESAAELAARAKRLEQMVLLQKRGRP